MVGLHQKDLGQTRCSLTRGIRKWNKMDQVAMTVLKMSGKVRGNKARVVTSHLACLLVSEVMPAPLLGCQCFTESEQAAAQRGRQWQKYIVFIISAALSTYGGGRCGAGLSRNGSEAKTSFY